MRSPRERQGVWEGGQPPPSPQVRFGRKRAGGQQEPEGRGTGGKGDGIRFRAWTPSPASALPNGGIGRPEVGCRCTSTISRSGWEEGRRDPPPLRPRLTEGRRREEVSGWRVGRVGCKGEGKGSGSGGRGKHGRVSKGCGWGPLKVLTCD